MIESRYIEVGCPEYVERIEPIIRAQGGDIPKVGLVALMEDEWGVSFVVVHLQPHVMMYVSPEHRKQGLGTALGIAAEAMHPSGAYIVVDHPASEAIAQKLGLEKVDQPVYRWRKP